MQPRRVVVFVHGLWMPGFELAWLRAQLRKAGFETCQFHYSTVRKDVAANAEDLFAFARDCGGDELHVVGYSLGGVVALEMLARFYDQLPPGRVVLVGSPVRGSNAAKHLTGSLWGKWLLGASAQHGLDEDHADCWHSQRELGVIAGTKSFGMGRVMAELPEPNDGTVALDETVLESAQDCVDFPLTHVTLMFSRRVANAIVAFLRSGSFKPR